MTKMTLPVSFNEPTSLLQRVTEDMVRSSYSSILNPTRLGIGSKPSLSHIPRESNDGPDREYAKLLIFAGVHRSIGYSS